MAQDTNTPAFTRRWAGAAVAAMLAVTPRLGVALTDDDAALVARLLGRAAVESTRLRLAMPAHFASGYTVPLSLDMDSPMTEVDHVRRFSIIAPKNPIVMVARFDLSPQSGRARVSTRIRLSKPQHVLASAELSDGSLLLTRTWVEVATDGCA